MNWLDFILLLIIAAHIYTGLRNGLMTRVVQLAGLFAAIYAAFKWGGRMVAWVEGFIPLSAIITAWIPADSTGGALVADLLIDAVGYLLVFIFVRIAFSMAASLLRQIRHVPVIGLVNGLMGGALGLMEGLLTVLIAVMVFSFLPIDFLARALDQSALVNLGRAYLPAAWLLLEDTFFNFFYGAV